MSARFSYVRMLASNRQKSEDAAEVFERDDMLVVVLADGAGGVRGGSLACGTLVAAVRAAVDDPSFAVDDVQYWADLFRVARERSVAPSGVVGTGDDQDGSGLASGTKDGPKCLSRATVTLFTLTN
jgi:hypothetical protein